MTACIAFIVPSPKRDDLHRDGRYAMHSFPADENEDAFTLAGTVRLDGGRRRPRPAGGAVPEERSQPATTAMDDQELFEFIDRTVPAHANDGSRRSVTAARRVERHPDAGSSTQTLRRSSQAWYTVRYSG